MAKVSFWQQQLLYFIPKTLRTKRLERTLNSLSFRQFRRSSGWFVLTAGLAALLFWHWKLMLATAVGAGMMLGVYLLQSANWPAYWSRWQRFFSGTQRQLTLAVGSGGLAALFTYIAATVWADTENRWLATGAIFQGMATLLTLILLSWQIAGRHFRRDEEKFEQCLADLTEADPLKRLIAIRRLMQLRRRDKLSLGDRRQVNEYFRLMLSRETETAVRNALIDGLQALDESQDGERSQPVLQMPLKLKRSPSQVHQFR